MTEDVRHKKKFRNVRGECRKRLRLCCAAPCARLRNVAGRRQILSPSPRLTGTPPPLTPHFDRVRDPPRAGLTNEASTPIILPCGAASPLIASSWTDVPLAVLRVGAANPRAPRGPAPVDTYAARATDLSFVSSFLSRLRTVLLQQAACAHRVKPMQAEGSNQPKEPPVRRRAGDGSHKADVAGVADGRRRCLLRVDVQREAAGRDVGRGKRTSSRATCPPPRVPAEGVP